MRDILFKAKRIDNGEWVVGSYALHPKGNCSISVILDKCKNPPDCDPMWQKVLISHEVDQKTVCQYTGLNDKNGNKIWENDVVRYKDDLANMVKEDLVEWNETHASFVRLHESKMGLQYLYIDECIANRCEVIGNTIDNPELLKGGIE